MNQKRKLVRGIGINDADSPVARYELIGVKFKKVWRCPFYSKWEHMLERCYGKTYHDTNPSYIGCSVDQAWHTFSVFKRWMETQDWHGKELDKDLIDRGNRVYSPDKCIFISPELNKFMTASDASRGLMPMGVGIKRSTGKLYARCCNPFTGTQEKIGSFICEIEAHARWQSRKHEHALVLASMEKDERIASALRTRYAPGTIHL